MFSFNLSPTNLSFGVTTIPSVPDEPTEANPSTHLVARDEIVVVVAGVGIVGQGDLAEIAGALGSFTAFLGSLQRGQQHRCEDSDDGDHHQQFNQGEPVPGWSHGNSPSRRSRQ